MATEEQQMQMLLESGGMQDDGMNRDPVSGNEVPPGSLAKEVRDDVPAQLSEGEYVIPADVVQYFGLKFFEDLIAEAKRGLLDMDRRGRIGGEPVPQEASAFPFNVDELQTTESSSAMMPQQANKGGLIRGFAPGGFTGVSDNASTSNLDYSKTRSYFSDPTKVSDKASVARFIAPGCNQKEVLVSGNRVPLTANSTQVDGVNYVDITSDAGLNILKGCSIKLNPEEEKIVIDRIGQSEYDKYKSGESRPIDSGNNIPEEPEPEASDDNEPREPEDDDFIRNWGMDKMESYYEDITRFYDGTEDTLVGGLLKGITKPIVKLNHKHVISRTISLLNKGVDPTTNKALTAGQIITLNNLLKTNPDGMIEGTFKANGKIISWNSETGTFESDDLNPTTVSGNINTNESGNALPSGISGDDPYDESFMLAAPGSAGIHGSSIGRDMSGKPTGLRLSQSDLDKIPENTGTKPVDTSKYKNKGYEGDRDDDDFSAQFSNTTSSATTTKTQDSAGPRNVGFEKQKDEDEADLSKAYSGGGDDNMAAGKFMNKGGLAKKKRRTTKKK